MICWLFAWEFGQGLGHLRRLGAITRHLVRSGDRAVLVTPPDAPLAELPPGVERMPLQAPDPPPCRAMTEGFLPSYGAALVELGFAKADYIMARLAAWDRILRAIRPAAIIADHAPYAVLAGKDRCAVAVIGTGLDLPPSDDDEFPPVLAELPSFDEAPLRAALAAGCRATGRPAAPSAPMALKGTRRFLVGLPDFDPYATRRSETHLGPIGARPPLTTCPAEGSVFAYLNALHPSFDELVSALAEAGLPGNAYWQGGQDPARAALLGARGVDVLRAPAVMADALPACSLVLSLGGAGLTAGALFAGRPHLILPIHLESELHALGLEQLGAGVRLSGYALCAAIEAAADTLALRDGAMRAALRLRDAFPTDPAPTIAAEIRSMA